MDEGERFGLGSHHSLIYPLKTASLWLLGGEYRNQKGAKRTIAGTEVVHRRFVAGDMDGFRFNFEIGQQMHLQR